jgi:hypothetical protein
MNANNINIPEKDFMAMLEFRATNSGSKTNDIFFRTATISYQ